MNIINEIRDIAGDIRHWSEHDYRKGLFERVFYLLDREERLDRPPFINTFLTGKVINELWMFYVEYREDLYRKKDEKIKRLKEEIKYYNSIIGQTEELYYHERIQIDLKIRRYYIYITLSLLSLLISVDLWIIPVLFSVIFYFMYTYYKSEALATRKYRDKFIEIVRYKLYQANQELYYLNKEE